MTPNIYVTHRTRLNLSEATKFGNLRFVCNNADPYPAPDGELPAKEAILADFEFAMKDFDAQKDFLLLVGDPIYCGLLMWLAINRTETGDILNVLRYDRLLGVYVPIEVRV